MRFLLVSDSHGNNAILEDLYSQYPNMDLYLHAGDSEAYTPFDLHQFISVKGNCDHFIDLPESFSFVTPYGKCLMKHHPYLRQNEKKDIKIFIHGHTHISEANYEDNIYHICPGSISYSRRGEESYMILNITEKSIQLTLYELETKNVLYTREIL